MADAAAKKTSKVASRPPTPWKIGGLVKLASFLDQHYVRLATGVLPSAVRVGPQSQVGRT